MRLAVALLLSLVALAPHAQPLPDSTRHLLQIELREMFAADQRVRAMYEYGTFSPCRADSLRESLRDLPLEENLARSQALKAEARARTSEAERAVLLRRMHQTDAANLARLREVIAAHGWPSAERIGGKVEPVVFLLHAPPDSIDAMRPALLAEVTGGRMPARDLATAVDKSRKIRGMRQLYGSGDEFDPETGTVQPPRIADIAETNAARAAIGLPPLEAYRE